MSCRQAMATPGDERLCFQVLVGISHLVPSLSEQVQAGLAPPADVLFPPHPGSSAGVI